MPTYLVCWCLGDFDSVTCQSDQIPVRVFMPKGKQDEGNFALNVAAKALTFYKDFFGVEYKLPKMDLIALSDFPIGAMENWGLLTFKERFLMLNDAQSGAKAKQNVALIVAHEVAHQVRICYIIPADYY